MQWDGSAKASQAIELLEAYAAGDSSAESALYDLLRADDVVTYYNDALDLASARIPDAEPRLHELARRLATEARDRGPVKFGIAMLGSMGEESDLPVIRTLALHDEFGLYAAEAIAELAPNRQAALYEMARKVTGWGRIEAVALMTATPDPNLRRWLLTEGFRNDVTPQYLAYHCATIANLDGVLNGDLPPALDDTALLAGIGDLLQSLVKPGPLREAQVYEHTPESAIAYLRQVQSQLRANKSTTFSFLLSAQVLSDYAASAPWSDEQKKTVTALAAPILQDKGWHKRIVASLGDDKANLPQAELAAHLLRVETFPIHLKRLNRNGASADRWQLRIHGSGSAAAQDARRRRRENFQPTLRAGRDRARGDIRRCPGSGVARCGEVSRHRHSARRGSVGGCEPADSASRGRNADALGRTLSARRIDARRVDRGGGWRSG